MFIAKTHLEINEYAIFCHYFVHNKYASEISRDLGVSISYVKRVLTRVRCKVSNEHAEIIANNEYVGKSPLVSAAVRQFFKLEQQTRALERSISDMMIERKSPAIIKAGRLLAYVVGAAAPASQQDELSGDFIRYATNLEQNGRRASFAIPLLVFRCVLLVRVAWSSSMSEMTKGGPKGTA